MYTHIYIKAGHPVSSFYVSWIDLYICVCVFWWVGGISFFVSLLPGMLYTMYTFSGCIYTCRWFQRDRGLARAMSACFTFDSGTLVSGSTWWSTTASPLTTGGSSSSTPPKRTSSGVPCSRRPMQSKYYMHQWNLWYRAHWIEDTCDFHRGFFQSSKLSTFWTSEEGSTSL